MAQLGYLADRAMPMRPHAADQPMRCELPSRVVRGVVGWGQARIDFHLGAPVAMPIAGHPSLNNL